MTAKRMIIRVVLVVLVVAAAGIYSWRNKAPVQGEVTYFYGIHEGKVRYAVVVDTPEKPAAVMVVDVPGSPGKDAKNGPSNYSERAQSFAVPGRMRTLSGNDDRIVRDEPLDLELAKAIELVGKRMGSSQPLE